MATSLWFWLLCMAALEPMHPLRLSLSSRDCALSSEKLLAIPFRMCPAAKINNY
jgi:hypothetical protein